MTAPDSGGIDQTISADDVIADLEQQLGAAMGQNSRLRIALREREKQLKFLTEQLAARDAAQHAPEPEHASS